MSLPKDTVSVGMRSSPFRPSEFKGAFDRSNSTRDLLAPKAEAERRARQ